MKRRMRHANGTGSVQKLSGRRRNPYNARITTGWTDEGKPVRKSLGCFSTRREADAALEAYYRDPYDFSGHPPTFSDVYEIVHESAVRNLSDSSVRGYKTAYNRCEPLYDKPLESIKTNALQAILDDCEKGYQTRRKIIVLYNAIYKYAMANDIVQKDYSRFVTNARRETDKHLERTVFTPAEISRLYSVDSPDAELVLILIYTGFRASELLSIRCANVDLINRTIRGGLKTEAGKNRIVPIHPAIFDFVRGRVDLDHEYLVRREDGRQMDYQHFKTTRFVPLMKSLGMDHLPHDCRHTFFSMLDAAGANHKAVETVGGHSSYKTTEKIYTHKDVEQLREAVESI